jgi:hypothetical protein
VLHHLRASTGRLSVAVGVHRRSPLAHWRRMTAQRQVPASSGHSPSHAERQVHPHCGHPYPPGGKGTMIVCGCKYCGTARPLYRVRQTERTRLPLPAVKVDDPPPHTLTGWVVRFACFGWRCRTGIHRRVATDSVQRERVQLVIRRAEDG